MATETIGKQDPEASEEGVGIEELRANVGDFVLRAGFGNERIPITRHGKRTAALIGMKDLERLRALDAEEAAPTPAAAGTTSNH